MSLLDALRLAWLAREFFQREMDALMTDSVRIVPPARASEP